MADKAKEKTGLNKEQLSALAFVRKNITLFITLGALSLAIVYTILRYIRFLQIQSHFDFFDINNGFMNLDMTDLVYNEASLLIRLVMLVVATIIPIIMCKAIIPDAIDYFREIIQKKTKKVNPVKNEEKECPIEMKDSTDTELDKLILKVVLQEKKIRNQKIFFECIYGLLTIGFALTIHVRFIYEYSLYFYATLLTMASLAFLAVAIVFLMFRLLINRITKEEFDLEFGGRSIVAYMLIMLPWIFYLFFIPVSQFDPDGLREFNITEDGRVVLITTGSYFVVSGVEIISEKNALIIHTEYQEKISAVGVKTKRVTFDHVLIPNRPPELDFDCLEL